MQNETFFIWHKVPFYCVRYDEILNHTNNTIIYIGTQAALADIPAELNCEKLIWQEQDGVHVLIEKMSLKTPAPRNFIALSEYQVDVAARIRAHFGIPGPSIAEAELSRNKLMMKAAVASSGLATPTCYSLNDTLQNPRILEAISSAKLVLKPLDGASSENVQIYSSHRALLMALNNNNTHIDDIDLRKNTARYQIEEFIEGDIWHVDGFVRSGEIALCVSSRYIGNCLDFAKGLPLGSLQCELPATLLAFSRQVVAAVDIQHGCFHLEVFQNASGWVFLEIGHRAGGASVVRAFELHTGVNLHHVHLSAQLGWMPDFATKTSANEDYYGWFVFPGHHLPEGYACIDNAGDFSSSACIHEWHQLPPDKKLCPALTYLETIAPVAGMLRTTSFREGQQFVLDMFENITVTSTTEAERSASCDDDPRGLSRLVNDFPA
ncbi:ATP-grasp domain-containing protein [Erwinia pyrifoliae]|uniref:ATP-grasp domain-containing protein n=1 Tax=Erwinia pyrifoliae TaxID=79967 RepID=UPI00019610BB|nr:ATP-grasp domain-containing protein [Erwinia pyrifoliae]AUX73999.1 ATP-grasp domain-containing protein [Erwinia pyrifoliae]MCA8875661.1 ATP-grasp domain-containing protein [Erwinia pyrifoliae]MCT2385866.1 ATP-grasp domain-containing protein [Erwinia pyrifoliae]MCU8588557.1 ATP-grasp domain-containing protein [Erwinia pyrifoliae]UXK12691.1 ATP-grasp domain-containing protein [Erwinia pyrifoliae]